jgi:murein DD-endopeptidase MepM/ murein hydrolase activator NlpD
MKRTGQTIAAVGHNGATAVPHLHFQLMFRLGGGRVPYEFDSFVLVEHVNQKTGRQLLPTPEPHTKQLPLTLNIVNFRDRS